MGVNYLLLANLSIPHDFINKVQCIRRVKRLQLRGKHVEREGRLAIAYDPMSISFPPWLTDSVIAQSTLTKLAPTQPDEISEG
jgi:hypothetical protein